MKAKMHSNLRPFAVKFYLGLLYLFIVLSPLPFGSARPIWEWGWMMVLAVAAIIYVVRHARFYGTWGEGAVYFKSIILVLPLLLLVPNILLSPSQEHLAGRFISFANFEGKASTPDILPDGAIIYIGHILLLILTVAVATKARTARYTLLKFIVHIVSLYAAYGLVIYFSGQETILWYEKGASRGAVSSTFVNRNNFATYCGMGLCVSFALLTSHFRQNSANGMRDGLDRFLQFFQFRWLVLIEVAIIATALILTGSRAGVISSLLAILTMLIIKYFRSKRRFLLHMVWFLFLLVGMTELSGDFLVQRLSVDPYAEQRFQLYPVLLNAIGDQPLTGYGFGNLEAVISIYRTENIAPHFVRAHNDYLELMLAGGMPIFGVSMLFALAALMLLIQNLKEKAAEHSIRVLGIGVFVLVAVHSLVDFPLQIPANSYLFTILMGVALASALELGKRRVRNVRGTG